MKEYVCETCGEIVDDKVKECPNCHSEFIEEGTILKELDKLGMGFLDTISQTIVSLFLALQFILTIVYFAQGLKAGIFTAIALSFFANAILPVFLLIRTPIGYFLIAILLIQKYLFQINYTKVMKKVKNITLTEEEKELVEEIQNERKNNKRLFIGLVIFYIIYFVLFLISMNITGRWMN